MLHTYSLKNLALLIQNFYNHREYEICEKAQTHNTILRKKTVLHNMDKYSQNCCRGDLNNLKSSQKCTY